MTKLSQRLKHLRQAQGLSAKDVAQKLNIPVSTYRDWELGTQITGEPYRELSSLFKVTLNSLMYGEEKKSSEQILKMLRVIKTSLEDLENEVITFL